MEEQIMNETETMFLMGFDLEYIIRMLDDQFGDLEHLIQDVFGYCFEKYPFGSSIGIGTIIEK